MYHSLDHGLLSFNRNFGEAAIRATYLEARASLTPKYSCQINVKWTAPSGFSWISEMRCVEISQSSWPQFARIQSKEGSRTMEIVHLKPLSPDYKSIFSLRKGAINRTKLSTQLTRHKTPPATLDLTQASSLFVWKSDSRRRLNLPPCAPPLSLHPIGNTQPLRISQPYLPPRLAHEPAALLRSEPDSVFRKPLLF